MSGPCRILTCPNDHEPPRRQEFASRGQGSIPQPTQRVTDRTAGLEPTEGMYHQRADPDVSPVSGLPLYLKDSVVRGGGVSEGVTNHAPYPVNRRTDTGHRHLDAGRRT